MFTIDPLTARDLDDALHIKRSILDDGTSCWEVGVHIADVSYFVREKTELDKWASERATSVYLVHKVNLLPKQNVNDINPEKLRGGRKQRLIKLYFAIFRLSQCYPGYYARSYVL